MRRRRVPSPGNSAPPLRFRAGADRDPAEQVDEHVAFEFRRDVDVAGAGVGPVAAVRGAGTGSPSRDVPIPGGARADGSSAYLLYGVGVGRPPSTSRPSNRA